MLKRKRQKFESDQKNHVLLHLQEQEQSRSHQPYNMLNIPMDTVKTEPRDTTPSPYGGQVYGGLSPMYVANSTLSPHQYRVPTDSLGPTPPPGEVQCNLSYNPLPSINNMLPQNWNILTNSVSAAQNDLGASNAMNIDTPSGLSSLLDLDSQQMELKQINLNSGELATLNMFDTHNLSENLSHNLSLTDISLTRQDPNMTDSFTQLANNVINSICQLNDMTKPN